jgi:hypothetical protein
MTHRRANRPLSKPGSERRKAGRILEFQSADTLARLAALEQLEALLAEAEGIQAWIAETLALEERLAGMFGLGLPQRRAGLPAASAVPSSEVTRTTRRLELVQSKIGSLSFSPAAPGKAKRGSRSL